MIDWWSDEDRAKAGIKLLNILFYSLLFSAVTFAVFVLVKSG